MTIERRNPLPVNRYWVDVFPHDQIAFRKWLADNASAVYVSETKTHEPSTWDKIVTDAGQSYDSYLFVVSSPVRWAGPGYPESLPANVGLDDIPQLPPPTPGLADTLEAAAETGRNIATAIIIVAVIVGGLVLLSKTKSRTAGS